LEALVNVLQSSKVLRRKSRMASENKHERELLGATFVSLCFWPAEKEGDEKQEIMIGEAFWSPGRISSGS